MRGPGGNLRLALFSGWNVTARYLDERPPGKFASGFKVYARARADCELAGLTVNSIADRPAFLAGWLNHEIEPRHKAIRDFPPGRTGL